MTTPVNLNRARKERARKAAKAQADANAVRFGRTKTEKAQESAVRIKGARDLDGHAKE
ncbi:hypothetical protein PARPLA_01959 [Rhodobacteraceae bacterium THAF1]|uniref:DUF4169 family protein n=1 Tax=Palleronia sp. THAF1 TaxID=2587842 RepID=UPI000F3E2DB5|nr:DUF4169 family protein [Palleronia sp. THAF1]QFU08906.1 hypothetical protein FIU81_09500 [Palleronia sp. THAF1]VDC24382.1 hypothetical protein PARPLA_01959 [Rhodobacteraceae bacterium THAF1]